MCNAVPAKVWFSPLSLVWAQLKDEACRAERYDWILLMKVNMDSYIYQGCIQGSHEGGYRYQLTSDCPTIKNAVTAHRDNKC